jgi:autoinducer 2-degrading protein
MYQFLVSFTVQPEHRDDFVRVARKAASDSLANEPGSLRFEVIADEEKPDVFYLNELYADADAFNVHASGPSFGAFFAEASGYAQGPTWLMRGTSSATRRSPDRTGRHVAKYRPIWTGEFQSQQQPEVADDVASAAGAQQAESAALSRTSASLLTT